LPALFITATGTDIGKTYVGVGLIAALRRRGRKVSALKPILSGFEADKSAASDPAALLAACGRTPDLEAIAGISPWRFTAPLSPDQAAAQEGKTIDFAATRRFCAAAIAAAEDIVLIEGIGGLMVPLTPQHTICDLIGALDIPLLLVGGTYLGSLSHTLTAIEVAEKRGLKIAGLVLNETAGATISIAATQESLRHFWSGLTIALHQAPDAPPAHAAANAAANAAAFEKLAEILP
jgi:dethiobiotin synthetase